jgi:hypothetical protein
MFVFTFFKINLKNIGVYIILIFFLHIFYMDKQIFSFVFFVYLYLFVSKIWAFYIFRVSAKQKWRLTSDLFLHIIALQISRHLG